MIIDFISDPTSFDQYFQHYNAQPSYSVLTGILSQCIEISNIDELCVYIARETYIRSILTKVQVLYQSIEQTDSLGMQEVNCYLESVKQWMASYGRLNS